MWGLTETDLKEGEAEFLILMKAYDENFSQMVNVRSSYTHDEVIWGAKWQTMLGDIENGKLILEMDKIGAFDKVQLPEFNVQTEADATDIQPFPATQMPQPDEALRAK